MDTVRYLSRTLSCILSVSFPKFQVNVGKGVLY